MEKKLVTLVFMMSTSTPLIADQLQRLEDSWYIGGAVGMSSLEPSAPVGSQVTDDKSLSIKGYAGVNISNQIGIEAFWSRLGDSSISGTAGTGTVKYSAIGVNGIYHLPVYAGRVHPFGKVGIAKINTRSPDVILNQKNNFALFGALGAEYDVTRQLKIRAEYEYFTEDINQLSIGLNWSPNPRIHYLDRKRAPARSATSALPAALPLVMPPAPIKQAPQPVKSNPVQVRTLNTSLSGASSFPSGSATLSRQDTARLDQLITKVKDRRFRLYHIRISGHTDNRGSRRQNIRLSRKRAEAVAHYIVSWGVPRAKISVVGYGESKPVATNHTAAGRAKNRRVEIEIKGAQTIVTRQ